MLRGMLWNLEHGAVIVEDGGRFLGLFGVRSASSSSRYFLAQLGMHLCSCQHSRGAGMGNDAPE